MKHAAHAEKDYSYAGEFDATKFQTGYSSEFSKVPKFNLASIPDVLWLVGKIGADKRVTDIRWSAYMLATAYVESSHTVRIVKQTKDKKGRVKSHRLKVWRNFAPVQEAGHGKGRKYESPVKVLRLPNGDAEITEYDGEQWKISAATGHPAPKGSGQKPGLGPQEEADPAYEASEGDAQYYFGRGLVQLTWWYNYATAGAKLGRGLDFLFDPALVDDKDVAYDILATGLCTGAIFAHGKKLQQYFHGGHTDYVHARDMVNPKVAHANKVEVAHLAERFEKVLFASRKLPAIVAKK